MKTTSTRSRRVRPAAASEAPVPPVASAASPSSSEPASSTDARSRPTAARPLPLDLALQGGGSHGAFTWGVLDRLLQEPWLEPAAVSGTSAGAVNAAVLATGWAEGGRDGARRALEAFWLDVATESGCFGATALPTVPWAAWWASPWGAGWPGQPAGAPVVPLSAFNLDQNPLYQWSQAFLRRFSPAQFNPADLNPLRDLLQRHVKPVALRAGPLSVFVTATAVRTGQPRVFSCDDLSVDALLASACLPQIFRAVEIDGEPYWDGGFSGNPALWPLIYHSRARDLLLVKINPLVRPGVPETPAEIHDRVNEITFNAGLVSEMRAIAFVQRLLEQGRIDAQAYKALRLHLVADDEALAPLLSSSKLNTERSFLLRLHGLGRAAADRFLAQHAADLGVKATLDPRAAFLGPRGLARV